MYLSQSDPCFTAIQISGGAITDSEGKSYGPHYEIVSLELAAGWYDYVVSIVVQQPPVLRMFTNNDKSLGLVEPTQRLERGELLCLFM